jgi:vacuolar protein sorting-associated protein 13A/C
VLIHNATELGGSDRVVLLTTMHVLCFWSTKLRLDWDLPFLKVEGVTIEDTGIRFAHKDGREQDRFIGIPKNGSKDWLFKQIEKSIFCERLLKLVSC